MKYTFAPMEGIGGHLYRQIQHEVFPGADRYYAPFITTTENDRVASHYLTDVLPENNKGLPLVPQIMANDAAAFLRMADKLGEMGYEEVDLNLGCPSGTVVKKGRGAGFLADPEGLDRFFGGIFEKPHPYRISIKVRIGTTNADEFDDLLRVFASWPIAEMTVHPRLLSDGYKHDVDLASFAKAMSMPFPVQYNGDIRCAADRDRILSAFPGVSGVMIGRGALADPGIFRMMKTGQTTEISEVRFFTACLLETYLAVYRTRHIVMEKMKEVWIHLSESFEGAEKSLKKVLKAQTLDEMNEAADALTQNCEFVPGRIKGIYV